MGKVFKFGQKLEFQPVEAALTLFLKHIYLIERVVTVTGLRGRPIGIAIIVCVGNKCSTCALDLWLAPEGSSNWVLSGRTIFAAWRSIAGE